MNKSSTAQIIRVILLACIFLSIAFISLVPKQPNTLSIAQSTASTAAQKALRYIAHQKNIPLADLTVAVDHSTTYPNLNRNFQVVTIVDTRADGHFYDLLVDLDTGIFEENLAALRKAEEKAYLTRYGKMEIALYNRLQQLKETDSLPIAIWVNGQGYRTQTELFEATATKFSQAQQAMAQSGKPWDIADPKLALKIKKEYNRLNLQETTARITPLANHLTQQGINVKTYGALPALTAFLSKADIEQLALHPHVAMLYLIDQAGHDKMDSAIPTQKVDIVWERGFTGTGVLVAILEDGLIDPESPCLNVIDTRSSSMLGPESHKTLVAGIVACNHNTHTGVAPGVLLLDADIDSRTYPSPYSQEDAIYSLRWAITVHTATVVNVSYGWGYDKELNWTDRAFDYWARNQFVFIAVAAGNDYENYFLSSPAKGWNVFSVGATSDNQTTTWVDDTMLFDSSYINPNSLHGDREKPEIVAVGGELITIDLGGDPITQVVNATSYATPQVSGLAALLIDRNSSLAIWPEASRAIMMASATNNITGPTDIPVGEDLLDGAGAINASLADIIAQNRNTSNVVPCLRSCWWGTTVSSNTVAVGDSVYRYFNAQAGERIRVAISWWSNADTMDNDYSFDRLDTDFNLNISYYDGSDWQLLPDVWSMSKDNNYELVDFVTPSTGKYRIDILRANVYNGETSNLIGIALLKLYNIYLPLRIKASS